MDVNNQQKGAESSERKDRICQSIRKVGNRLGIEISPEMLDLSVTYIEELLRWNKAFNLVGRRLDLEGVLLLFLDSLTPLMMKGVFSEGVEVLDIGSGAGMPGIPLYLIGGPFPLTMAEAQRKRVTFLRHICRKLGLSRAYVYPGRIEEMRKHEDYMSFFDVGLARAVMDPMKLLGIAGPLISEGGKLVLFVGSSDGERLRRGASGLEKRGWRMESLRSTQRYVGRDNYLAILKKTS
jgi:16S rRNA (guanine527-N7)-methyltransferase